MGIRVHRRDVLKNASTREIRTWFAGQMEWLVLKPVFDQLEVNKYIGNVT
jgi:hypothetical protein